MADESDVEEALVLLLSSTLYPNGTGAGSAIAADCRIYRGWPNSSALDADLRANIINVTVFPASGAGRVTSRYLRRWEVSHAAPNLSASISGTSVTFSGTASPGQLAGLAVNGQTFVYATGSADTPVTVAANLASQARSATIVLVSGAMLSIPGAWSLKARVVAQGQAVSQVRRQSYSLRVTCWCPSPQTRDSAAMAIDQAFSQVAFLQLSDGSQARMTYEGTLVLDQSQDALLYRRDLLYALEYPTLLTQTQPAMLFGELDVGGASLPA